MTLNIGQAVTYVDPYGVERAAILTAVHGTEWVATVDGVEKLMYPCVNLVFVSGDEKRHDTFGRQVERESSVQHESTFPAHGRFYRV